MWIFAVYVIIAEIFQVGGSDLLAAGAAIGVAIGFAAQDILKNIFGGILIILDQPFQVGDKINVGGTYGEVVSIGLRSTRIVTPDDNLVTVPNAQVVDGQVANANAGALDCQVVTDLYLPGWVDVMKAKAIAYQAAANSKYVYLDKPIVVIVRDEFKETFLTHLKVKAYVLDTRYEFTFMSDVTEMAKAEFLREGMLWPVWGLDHLALPGNGEAIADKPTGES
jgi:small-conductance mechanosensitive channel